jgi:hypothetical protein
MNGRIIIPNFTSPFHNLLSAYQFLVQPSKSLVPGWWIFLPLPVFFYGIMFSFFQSYHAVDLEPDSSKRYHFAISGKSFSVIRSYFKDLVPKVRRFVKSGMEYRGRFTRFQHLPCISEFFSKNLSLKCYTWMTYPLGL